MTRTNFIRYATPGGGAAGSEASEASERAGTSGTSGEATGDDRQQS